MTTTDNDLKLTPEEVAAFESPKFPLTDTGVDQCFDEMLQETWDKEMYEREVTALCNDCDAAIEMSKEGYEEKIKELNHEAENQMNRIQELEDKLAAAHKAMAAGEALARAVMLDQTGEG